MKRSPSIFLVGAFALLVASSAAAFAKVTMQDCPTGTLLEAADYSVWGERSDKAVGGSMPEGLTLRDHFSGKEDQSVEFALPYLNFGARFYAPDLKRWLTVDPLSEKYYGVSPYAYCANNPVNLVDPDGMRTDVIANSDSTYTVKMVDPTDDDNGVYLEDGTLLGYTISPYSFFDFGDGKTPSEGSAAFQMKIDLNDTSGDKFLKKASRTQLVPYMVLALPGMPYDFKITNGKFFHKKSGTELDPFRGMSIKINGQTYIASARDVGNIAAGMQAAMHYIPYPIARIAFDSLETITDKIKGIIPSEGVLIKENPTTSCAQEFGYYETLPKIFKRRK